MPFLIVEAGPEAGRKIDLTGQLVIGRQARVGLSIKDPKASREHTRIEPAAGSWCVVDLQSTNGTLLNGRKVDREFLKAGDRVTVGQTVFRFEEGDASPDQTTRPMKEPGSAPAPPAAVPGGPPASAPVTPRPMAAPGAAPTPRTTPAPVRPLPDPSPAAAAAAAPGAEPVVQRTGPTLRYQEQKGGPGFFTIVFCTAVLVGLVFAARWIGQRAIAKAILERKQGQPNP